MPNRILANNRPLELSPRAFSALLRFQRPAFLAFEPRQCRELCHGVQGLWAQLAPEFPELLFGRVSCVAATGILGEGACSVASAHNSSGAAAPNTGLLMMRERRGRGESRSTAPLLKIRVHTTFEMYQGQITLENVQKFVVSKLSSRDPRAKWSKRRGFQTVGASAEDMERASRPLPTLMAMHPHAPRPAGDWVFIAHHKSGTTVGKVLVDVLCSATNRPVYKYTYRELPLAEGRRPGEGGACHFLVKVYHEDLYRWLSLLEASPRHRLVHFVRDPIQMVASGYLFHRRGSELAWTNSTRCSRDLCALPELWGAQKSKLTAAPIFHSLMAAPWLKQYGCDPSLGAEGATLHRCLNALPVRAGLEVEARRAHNTLRTMLDVDELVRSPQTYSLRLDWLAHATFNATVRTLVRWLEPHSTPSKSSSKSPSKSSSKSSSGATDSAAAAGWSSRLSSLRLFHERLSKPAGLEPPPRFDAERVLSRAYRACFSSARVVGDKALAIQGIKTARKDDEQAAITAAVKQWVQRGATPALRELSARCRCSRAALELQPLFSARQPVAPQPGSRGIISCTAPPILASTLAMVKRLQRAGNRLPLELWHVGELSDADLATLRSFPSATPLVARDLSGVLSPHLAADEIGKLRGYMCKPLSLLATELDDVLLVDHDAHFYSDPTDLFRSASYNASGMLMFRDRLQRHLRGQPIKDASRYVRHLIRKRMASQSFLPDIDVSWPWRPSEDLIRSPIVSGESNHQIDSSVLLLSKSRSPRLLSTLYALHERYRHEMYANLHGDKETYWLACELVGGLSCGVSPLAAGEMGLLRRRDKTSDSGYADGRLCLMGNLLQFHPDEPQRLIHCNCKKQAAWQYTHVTLPELVTKSIARARDAALNRSINLAVVRGVAMQLRSGNATPLQDALELGVQQHFFARQCVATVETIEEALSRLPAAKGASSFCEQFGLRCPRPSPWDRVSRGPTAARGPFSPRGLRRQANGTGPARGAGGERAAANRSTFGGRGRGRAGRFSRGAFAGPE